MNHLIIGTAGHIDHGKTALVRALTGIECDTHPEEKRRGITINLGFAHLPLPNGDVAGIVDVPGHRDFIHTMVSGASAIDIALLVIAADGGVMPQTKEHLAIMEMLGVRRGLIALTRIDCADTQTRETTRSEVSALVKETFLDGAPVYPVSSITRQGIPELVAGIADVCAGADRTHRGDLFRMYIDRIFSVSGFGTVVTGSVLGGKAASGQELYLIPGEKKVRVRRIERYGHQAEEVFGGDRASLNLAGLSRDEFIRGMLVAERPLRSTRLIDVRVKFFADAPEAGRWSTLQFYMGTFEAQVRMHLIDADTLRGGNEAIAQLHLPLPCAPQAGDRFILRSTSGDITIGGGVIIDAAPLHHRRRPPDLVEKLHTIAGGALPDLINAELEKFSGIVPIERIARNLNRTPERIEETIRSSAISCSLIPAGREMFAVTGMAVDNLHARIIEILSTHHQLNPLDPSGKTAEELLGMLGFEQDASFGKMLETILAGLANRKKIKPVKHTWALADHSVETAGLGFESAIRSIDAALAASGMKTPLESDLRETARGHGIDDRMLRQVLRHLVAAHRAYEIEGAWLHASMVDAVRNKLLRELEQQSAGLTVAQFRDLIGGNRKLCLLLYALFDREGITVREGDVRKITPKGLQTARLPG
jgi:selenocysteine-specific elongation factor